MKVKKKVTINRRNSSRLVVGLLMFLVVGLALSQLLVANAYSTKGYDLRSIERELSFLRKDNLKLKNEISSYKSLRVLEQEAEKLGMTKVDHHNIEILSDPTLVLNR